MSVPPPPSLAAVEADAGADYFFSKANLLAGEGQDEAALGALRRAIELDPESAYLRLAEAELALRLGKEDEARQAAEQALVADPDSIEAHTLLGNFYFNRDDFGPAAEQFGAAHKLAPEQESLVLHLAIALARNDQIDQAVAVLKAFLQNHPAAVRVELTLADLYQEQGEPSAAEQIYHAILKRSPDFATARLELGKLYERQPEGLEKALAVYREILTAHPGDDQLRHHVVSLLIRSGRLDEAKTELETILGDQPEDLEALRKLGLIALDQGRWEDAAGIFRKLLELRPDLDQARYFLGTALERQGDIPAALAAFGAVGSDSPFGEDAVFHRAYLLDRLDRTGAAIALLQARLRSPVERADLYELLAALYEKNGRQEDGLATIDQGLSAFPDNVGLHYQKASLLERSGRRQEASREMERVLQLDPENAEALNYLAYLWAEQDRNLEQALDYARRAVKITDKPHIRDTLGWVYFRLGRLEEAQAQLQKAVDGLPRDPVVLGHLGDVCRASNLLDLAAIYYRRALENDKENKSIKEKLEKVLELLGKQK